MPVAVTSPATLLDLAELGGAASRNEWAILRDMHANGQTWAFRQMPDRRVPRRDGNLLLVTGLYPMAEGVAEAWFNAAPASASAILAIVRFVRLTIGGAGYREIVTVCRSQQGRRIAAACGFSFHATTELGDVWQWKPSSETAQRSRPKPSSAGRSPSSPGSRASSTSRPPAAEPGGAAVGRS